MSLRRFSDVTSKALDSAVVKLTGAQTVEGVKIFKNMTPDQEITRFQGADGYIKMNGGIAIDIGSAIDTWAGEYHSRKYLRELLNEKK